MTAEPPSAPRRTRRRSRLLLALLLLCGLLLALEVAVRVAGVVDLTRGITSPHQAAFDASHPFVVVDDPALSYANRPLAAATIEGIEYRHDIHGRRTLPDAPAEASGEAPAEAPGVVFLGDSTTYGFHVRAEDTLPALVARLLRIRPLNLGVCGYTTSQEAALYATQSRSFGDAPLVVLVFFPNDFSGAVFRWDDRQHALYADPLPLPHAWKRWLWHSAVYQALVSRLPEQDEGYGAFDPFDPSNQARTLAAVELLAQRVRADGRQLVVAHLPSMQRLDPYVHAEPIARLARCCKRLGVPFVDLLPAFLEERTRQSAALLARAGRQPTSEESATFLSRYWADPLTDHHLNAAGNRVAAEALAAALQPHLEH